MIRVASSAAPNALSVHHTPMMISSTQIRATVIIPAYNEQDALPHVLEQVLAVLDNSFEVIVVDDGSQDETRNIALSFPCRVIAHEINQGKGAAMRTGIQHASADKIIFIDGDATYPADAIPRIVEQLDHFDLVRCVRSNGRKNIPLINRIGNTIFDSIIKTMHQVEGSDVLSGLYGLKKPHLLAMRLESKGFDIETEIMVKAGAMKLRNLSLPIQYNERIGEKKLNPVRDGLKILRRSVSLAIRFKPIAIYVLPGLSLSTMGLATLVSIGANPKIIPDASQRLHVMMLSTTALLAGIQLVSLGGIVNTQALEAGLARPNQALNILSARRYRYAKALLGSSMIAAGGLWSLACLWAWISGKKNRFGKQETWVLAPAVIVWGIQILSTSLLLSLSAKSASNQKTSPQSPNNTPLGGDNRPEIEPVQREVGNC